MEHDEDKLKCELKKSKGKERKLKKKCKSAVKKYEKRSQETLLIAEWFEMLVEKLKTRMIKDVLTFQNEE